MLFPLESDMFHSFIIGLALPFRLELEHLIEAGFLSLKLLTIQGL